MIYIASPLHASRSPRAPAPVRRRVPLRCRAPSSTQPIAHSHPITERFKLPVDWNFWQHFDRAMIQKSDGLEVLMLPGWRRSVGVTAEINFARGLPIAFKEFVVKAVHNASAAVPPSFRAYPE